VQTYGSFGQIPGTWNPVAGADAGATLSGDGGANSLTGTVNNDTLIGLAGNDTLTGGMGADRFVFNTALNAGNQRRHDHRLQQRDGQDPARPPDPDGAHDRHPGGKQLRRRSGCHSP
jgi:Ca2+-binding RTX toxin-like protein